MISVIAIRRFALGNIELTASQQQFRTSRQTSCDGKPERWGANPVVSGCRGVTLSAANSASRL